MSRIAKGLAFAAGASLAIALTSKYTRRPMRSEPARSEPTRSEPANDPAHRRDEVLSVEPLLDRLERVEAELDRRLREHDAELEKTVDRKVSARISAFERTLLEQSISIRALSNGAENADANALRQIAAIERLCERMPPSAASPAPASFETQLERALDNPQPQREFRAVGAIDDSTR